MCPKHKTIIGVGSTGQEGHSTPRLRIHGIGRHLFPYPLVPNDRLHMVEVGGEVHVACVKV